MFKPHWRCADCDGSRYRIFKTGIGCLKCGKFFQRDASEVRDS